MILCKLGYGGGIRIFELLASATVAKFERQIFHFNYFKF